MSLLPAAAALLLAGAPVATALAQAGHAHVHGVARLDVAVDGGRVELRLTAAMQDLVGFERAPRDAEDEARLQAARKAVLDHARLWRFNAAARCIAEGPVLEVPGTASMEVHDHHDHDHEHHGDGGEHADWSVRYRFQCAQPSALKAIDSGAFDVFPALETVEVQVVDGAGARAETLSAFARRIAVTP
jgi:hypothetical protein